MNKALAPALLRIAGPIRRTDAEPHHAVKRRMRPIHDARDVAVLHRIEMDVVNMALEIRLMADCVLPIATLPDPSLASGSNKASATKHTICYPRSTTGSLKGTTPATWARLESSSTISREGNQVCTLTEQAVQGFDASFARPL